jgi:serine phosphatase RsbU (regulator of sigma subunit)
MKRSRHGYYCALAFFFLLVGGAMYFVRNHGFFPNTFFTSHGVYIGITVMIIFLSLGISDKINKIIRDFESINVKLENTVKQKTEELWKAIEEIQVMNQDLINAEQALWGEMEIAKRLQTILLPRNPIIDGYDLTCYSAPAKEVGGDYYDVIHINDSDWIVIGDVSGHGVSAGLVMMMAQTSIHALLNGNPGLNPSELLKSVNVTLYGNIALMKDDKYMTITVLELKHDGVFVHSGLHLDMLIYRAEKNMVERIETTGSWLGLFNDIKDALIDGSVSLKKGDVMFLYTDGIIEAWRKGSIKNKRNPQDDMYGTDRLVNTFQGVGTEDTEVIKKTLLESLQEFDTDDDVTMIILKRCE